MKTGEVELVKVQYGEGIASHSGPESCAGDREGAGEALTGEGVSRVLSREILTMLRGATAVRASERPHWAYRYREVRPDPARSETPSAHRSISRGRREIPRLATADGAVVRAENPQGARRR